MGSIALTVLTLTLGAFFMFVGHFKVTDKFFPDVYEDMRREFGRVNNVFPLYKQTGWRPFAKNYRLAVGLAEFIGGAVLVFVPGRLKQVANVVLLAVMLGVVYTHYALNDKFERVAPGLVFSLLLLTRLIIHRQVTQREKRLSAQKKPVKVETPKKKVQEVEIEQESDDQESQSDGSEDNQETKADKKNDKKNK